MVDFVLLLHSLIHTCNLSATSLCMNVLHCFILFLHFWLKCAKFFCWVSLDLMSSMICSTRTNFLFYYKKQCRNNGKPIHAIQRQHRTTVCNKSLGCVHIFQAYIIKLVLLNRTSNGNNKHRFSVYIIAKIVFKSFKTEQYWSMEVTMVLLFLGHLGFRRKLVSSWCIKIKYHFPLYFVKLKL